MNPSEYDERLKSTGRNEPCPCGSGRKYKQCHLREDEEAQHAALAKAAEEREAIVAADAEADKDGENDSAQSGTHRRDAHQHEGRVRGGQNRPTNIPRRGAI